MTDYMKKVDAIIQANPRILEDEQFSVVKDIYRDHYRNEKRGSELLQNIPSFLEPKYLHQKKHLSEKDEDRLFTWYRNIWRSKGQAGIELIRIEEREYNNRYKDIFAKRKFANLSKDELLNKKERWFMVNWVEENSDWEDCPEHIMKWESYDECKLREEAEKRYYLNYSAEDSALDAVGGEEGALCNIE